MMIVTVQKAMVALALLLTFPANCLAFPEGLVERGSGDAKYLGVFSVYTARLYTEPEITREKILNAETSRCLEIQYNVSISAKDIIEGANTVLQRQYGQTLAEPEKKLIDLLHRSYNDVGRGDRYTLCYDYSTLTTTLSFNDYTVISFRSSEFATIYFGIWLAQNNPLDQSLRQDLLSNLTEDDQDGEL